MCQQQLAAAGYAQYEVSAYAREGRRCAHNLNYWAFGDYIGIGAGAHGKISDAANDTVTRTTKVKLPRSYLERAARADSFGTFDPVASAQLPFEFMLNALRLNEGTSIREFEERTGVSGDALESPLACAREREWIEPDARLLRPTESGRRFLNDLIGLFLPE